MSQVDAGRDRLWQGDCGIAFDVVLVIAAVVGAGSRGEIDIVADDACAPSGFEEFVEGAVAGLVGAERGDQRFAIEGRHIRRTG